MAALGVPASCLAQPYPLLISSDSTYQLMEEGRSAILNFQLYEAERLFKALSVRSDGQPTAAFYQTTIAYLKVLIRDERVYYDQFFHRSDSLIDVLKLLPRSKWKGWLLGEAELQRAFMAAKSERFVRAALAGRSGYKNLVGTTKDYPDFVEPYKTLGLVHVLIGSLPTGFQRLLRIFGFHGSVEQGYEELELASKKSPLVREEALMFRALSDITLSESTEGGVDILANLQASWPQSPLFGYLYGFGLLSNREALLAEVHLRAAVAAGQQAEYFYIDYADFFLAQSLFYQNQFEEAAYYYERYLNRHRGLALQAQAYFELGLALDMLDNREEAIAAYQHVEVERAYDHDAYAYRIAQLRIKAPMTANERTLLRGTNFFDGGQYGKADSVLKEVFHSDNATVNEQAEASFRMGRVYHAEGRLAEALKAYRYTLAHPGTDEKTRWQPWSQFFIGEIYAQQADTVAAMQAYNATLTYKGEYDYHQALEQKTKVAMERLQSGR